MNWRERLPFLVFGSGDEPTIAWDDAGRRGYQGTDGGFVCRDDPRLAEYEAWCLERIEDQSRDAKTTIEAIHDGIIDTADREPFSRAAVRRDPDLIPWLMGGKPDHGPTIFEDKVLLPAYNERRRLISEDGLRGVASSKGTPVQGEGGAEPEPSHDDRLHALFDADTARIAAIAGDPAKSADTKMREIVEIDRRWAGKKSPDWATLLGVTASAVRDTDYWKRRDKD